MKSTLTIAVALLVGLSLTANDWPRWRGPLGDDLSKETGLLKEWPKDGPKLVWSFKDSGVGYGSPAVVGDTIYLAGAEDPEKGDKEFITCVSLKTGRAVWKTALTTSPGSYNGGWGSGPRSTPTVDGDVVYALGGRGDLHAIDRKDGSVKWKKNLVSEFGGAIPTWGYSESILIDGDRLVCTPGGKRGALAFLNKNTGEELLRSSNNDDAAYSSVIIATLGTVKMYITMSPKGVYGVDAKTGQELWRSAAASNGVAVIPTPIYHDGKVFVTSGYGAGCGLISLKAVGDKVTATDVYKNKAIVNHHGGVVLVDGHIFGYADNGGRWMCLDYLKDSREPVWENKSLSKGSLMYADGHLYLYGEKKGECVLIEASAKEWKESGRFTIPETTKTPRKSGAIWTHPVVANGKLFLRDHELLFCYDVGAK